MESYNDMGENLIFIKHPTFKKNVHWASKHEDVSKQYEV